MKDNHGSTAFIDIMAGLEDALAYAKGESGRGQETVVERNPAAIVDVQRDPHETFEVRTPTITDKGERKVQGRTTVEGQ